MWHITLPSYEPAGVEPCIERSDYHETSEPEPCTGQPGEVSSPTVRKSSTGDPTPVGYPAFSVNYD